MTIAYDSSASSTRGSGNTSSVISFTHTPSGTPKGVAVLINYRNQASGTPDYINSVTYGGVSLSRVIRAVDASSERGTADLWFLGSSVPTGAKVVNANIESTNTTSFQVCSVTMTGASDIEVVDSDSIQGDTTDPSLTLQYSGRTCLALAGQFGGATDPNDFTPNANCTRVAQAAFASSHGLVIRQTTPANADFAIGGTLVLEDNAYVAAAFADTGSTPSSGTIVHVQSSGYTVGNETTGGHIVIPSTASSGDDLIVAVTSRNHTSGNALPTVTDNDTGGNTFTLIQSSTDRKATLWWKKATANSASKTVTVAGCINSSAAGLSVYRNADPVYPFSNLTLSSLVTANPSIGGFTPDAANGMICGIVFNVTDSDTYSAMSCTNPGSLTSRFQIVSTGGVDAVAWHASELLTTASPTGNFHWPMASNHSQYFMSFALLSSTTTVPSSTSTQNSDTTRNPIHTYASAGTYIVQLIVTDNDGNVSSATTRSVHVS